MNALDWATKASRYCLGQSSSLFGARRTFGTDRVKHGYENGKIGRFNFSAVLSVVLVRNLRVTNPNPTRGRVQNSSDRISDCLGNTGGYLIPASNNRANVDYWHLRGLAIAMGGGRQLATPGTGLPLGGRVWPYWMYGPHSNFR